MELVGKHSRLQYCQFLCSNSPPAASVLWCGLQAGAGLSLADVSVLCAVQPLLSSVLSAEARQPYPALLAWLQACSSNSTISTVMGEGGLSLGGGGLGGTGAQWGGLDQWQ